VVTPGDAEESEESVAGAMLVADPDVSGAATLDDGTAVVGAVVVEDDDPLHATRASDDTVSATAERVTIPPKPKTMRAR